MSFHLDTTPSYRPSHIPGYRILEPEEVVQAGDLLMRDTHDQDIDPHAYVTISIGYTPKSWRREYGTYASLFIRRVS